MIFNFNEIKDFKLFLILMNNVEISASLISLLRSMSWPFYHRNVSRLEAEELLQQDKEDGSFLIRDSESFPGAYALCIM